MDSSERTRPIRVRILEILDRKGLSRGLRWLSGLLSLTLASSIWLPSLNIAQGGAGAAGNYRAWRAIVPPDAESRLFFSQREPADGPPQMDRAAERLDAACRAWREHYVAMKVSGLDLLLSMEEDPSGRIVIHDHREEEPAVHVLEGVEAEVYRFFSRRRRIEEMGEAGLPCGQSAEVLGALHVRRLVFIEGGEALSLAIERVGSPAATCGERREGGR